MDNEILWVSSKMVDPRAKKIKSHHRIDFSKVFDRWNGSKIRFKNYEIPTISITGRELGFRWCSIRLLNGRKYRQKLENHKSRKL